MIDKSDIRVQLIDLGVNPKILSGINKESVFNRYCEPHRFYHTWDHIDELLKLLHTTPFYNKQDTAILFLAIIFHDIIYDPKSLTNEEDSAEYFKSNFKGDDEVINKVVQIILDTKTHKGSSTLSDIFQGWDLKVIQQPLDKLLEYEEKIFKEFQWVDWKDYKTERIKILNALEKKANWFLEPNKISELIQYINNRKPKIGIYAGSFNPFHKGHYNILKKAEAIFDKIIIARGKSSSKKGNKIYDLPDELKYRQVDNYNGLLTDYITNLGYDVTLIRGLRNATDLQAELTQYRYLQDLKPDLKICLIPCDTEYEYISSTAIRELEEYGAESKYLL